MHLTQKQIELLRVIGARNEDGSAVDLDQILETLPYKTTKQSLQFSIRALIAHALIQKDAPEKRRGRTRTLISLTKAGEIMNGMPKKTQSFVTDVEDDEVLESLSEVLE
jgi:hypothetical protein